MPYTPPLRDFSFILDHVVGFDQVRASDRFGDATPDTVQAILSEGGRLCAEVIAPLRRPGDVTPTRLENGAVVSPPGYAEGLSRAGERRLDRHFRRPRAFGGMGMPQTVSTAFYEMMSAACLSLQMNPLLTQGQIEALEHHASDEIKALYLPKLISGEWSGTMNLTEPQAGTDLGALRTKAEPQADGSYRISGQKIYISWGDCDFTDNVCHLVLARLPDAPPGSKGISLFLVPKIIPNPDGSLGQPNSLRVVSLEHKLGIHGSPTCVMEYDGATGWLVGAPHKGLAAMFTMMNNARVGVGVQGIGVAEGAYQHALAYARTASRGQRPRGTPRSSTTPIFAANWRSCAPRYSPPARLPWPIAWRSTWPPPPAGGLGGARGVSDADHQGAWHGTGDHRVRHGHPDPWRHGFHRGNRRRAIPARCARDGDLRGHECHSGA